MEDIVAILRMKSVGLSEFWDELRLIIRCGRWLYLVFLCQKWEPNTRVLVKKMRSPLSLQLSFRPKMRTKRRKEIVSMRSPPSLFVIQEYSSSSREHLLLYELFGNNCSENCNGLVGFNASSNSLWFVFSESCLGSENLKVTHPDTFWTMHFEPQSFSSIVRYRDIIERSRRLLCLLHLGKQEYIYLWTVHRRRRCRRGPVCIER